MADQFQTSFIPKRVVETEVSHDSISGSGLTLFIGIIALVISLVLAGGVFAYDSYLKGAVVRKREQLQQQREAFAPELIREMSRLSTKLSVADGLVRNHVAVSGIFELLQDITLKTIRFNSFSFSNTDKGVQVVLQGEGLSFTSVALQADEFAKNPNLTGSIFSGFALDQRGNVSFSVTTLVNSLVISYPENMKNGGSARIQMQSQAVDMTTDIAPLSNDAQGTQVSDDGSSVGVADLEEDLMELDDLGDDASLNGL